jgi:hypothetical protein
MKKPAPGEARVRGGISASSARLRGREECRAMTPNCRRSLGQGRGGPRNKSEVVPAGTAKLRLSGRFMSRCCPGPFSESAARTRAATMLARTVPASEPLLFTYCSSPKSILVSITDVLLQCTGHANVRFFPIFRLTCFLKRVYRFVIPVGAVQTLPKRCKSYNRFDRFKVKRPILGRAKVERAHPSHSFLSTPS